MKRLILAIGVCALLFLGGCGEQKPEESKPAPAAEQPKAEQPAAEQPADKSNEGHVYTDQDLLHHNYILTKLDGQPVTAESPKGKPSLAFNENMNITGAVCNRFTGQAELKDNTLKAPALAMTRMMCPDAAINELENIFGAMMGGGAKMTKIDDKTFTLSDDKHTLTFELKDLVQ